jgi:hypothetical protein
LTGAATATEDSVRYIRWYSFVNRNFKQTKIRQHV